MQKYWTVKTYVKSLLNAAGLKAEGTTEGMLIEFTEHVMGLKIRSLLSIRWIN